VAHIFRGQMPFLLLTSIKGARRSPKHRM